MELYNNEIDLASVNEKIEALREEVSKAIIGQKTLIQWIINGLLCNGHLLLEGNPGLAKTTTARCIAKTIDSGFSRIQFTPDLMPADILGSYIFNPQLHQFEFKKGPVFSNIILIDEINRAPARTQSALFEVMEERQVSIDGHQHNLDFPFLVLATQNPIEMEGTYRLPEAQLDRFQLKIDIPYPSAEEEIAMLSHFKEGKDLSTLKDVQTVWSVQDLKYMQSLVLTVRIDDNLIQYITQIVQQSRKSRDFILGASPRAAIYLLKSARAHALISGRDYVIPEDIVDVSLPVLSHRLIMSAERELDGVSMDALIKKLLKSIEVPR
jgi:MoxR-like ATPase